MNPITFIGIIIVILKTTLVITQNDIKKNSPYSTVSQLGYIYIYITFSCKNIFALNWELTLEP